MHKKTTPIPPLQPEAFPPPVTGSDMIAQYKITEVPIREQLFENLLEEARDFSHSIFSVVKFVNCRFFNCSFERAEFMDVIFQSCDFSGCDFSNSYVQRVQFQSCKAMGTRFSDGIFMHVAIEECNFNYVNFDNSKLENVKIEQTELNAGNIAQCKCKNIHWRNVNLKNTSFFHTPMCGMDLSECMITGLVLSDGHEELKGAVVDLYQAAELAKRMGIIIKE